MPLINKHIIPLLFTLTAFLLVITANLINTQTGDAPTFRTVEDVDTIGPTAHSEHATKDGPLWTRDSSFSPSNEYDQIYAQQTASENDRPYCATFSNPNVCTFAGRISAEQNTTELWAYNHNCVQICYIPSALVPYAGQAFGFDSQLKAVSVAYFYQTYAPTSIAYGYLQFCGWAVGTSCCNNGGPSDLAPGFRLVCFVPFNC